MTAKIDGTNGVLQQYDYQVPTTGFSYTFAAGTTVLVMNPAGTLATGTITMPASPVDGMTISFSSTKQITALTVQGNTGQSIVGNPTTMLAGGAATFVYRLSNTTWYAQTNTAAVGAVVATSPAPVLNVFVSPGTWTKPATVVGIKVTVVGGGGSGANGIQYNTTPTAQAQGAGGGGGGGGAAIRVYPAPSLPGPQPYTVGTAGGTSSFGVAPVTVISATGGSNGSAATPFSSPAPSTTAMNIASGGAGGVGSSGNVNIDGSGGGVGVSNTQSRTVSGSGGNSLLGGGAVGVNTAPALVPATKNNGNAGGDYGGGGSGGGGAGPNGTGTGGTGATGVVIIEEFY